MKMNKGFMYLILLMICLGVMGMSFGQSSSLSSTRNAIKTYKEKIINTPLRINLKFKKTLFYPDHKILEILPDNKAKIQVSNSGNDAAGDETEITIMDYSPEYQIPYKEHEENVLIYMFQERYYYERWDPQNNDVGHYIEAYDGKDSMIMNTFVIANTGEKKREGKIYPGTRKSIAVKFNPLMAWGVKDWPSESFTISNRDDGKIKIEYNKENQKFISLLSPRNYMFLSTCIEKPNFKMEMRVNNTVDINDMSLPSDIEQLKFNHEGKPEYIFHFKNVKYEIISSDEVNTKCKIKLPEGTIIREEKELLGLPE